MRELSIFIDESGDFGPPQGHSPFYVLSVVFHDQSDDITSHLAKIHAALKIRGLAANHAIHTGPLIRREQDYVWMGMPERPALFRVLVDFVRTSDVTYHSLVFSKREHPDIDRLIGAMSRELGAFIQTHYDFFTGWDRVVIYYDNGQRELTTLVNRVTSRSVGSSRQVTPCFRPRTCSAPWPFYAARSRQSGCRSPNESSSRRPKRGRNEHSPRYGGNVGD